MHLPKVTFCLLTYNQESYIRSAIESALDQDYRGEIEYIVSDDGSTDRTYEIIKDAVARFNRAKVTLNHHKTNLGLGSNVNYALAHATGEFVILGDGDDVFMSNRVSLAVGYLESHPNAIMVDGGYNVVDAQGKVWLTVNQNAGAVYTISDFSPWGTIWCNGCCRTIRRELIGLYPDFNRDIYDHDMPMIGRALMSNNEIHIIGDVLVNYRVHTNNLTNADNIKRYNRKALYRQYMNDLSHAKEMKYLNTKAALGAWLFVKKYQTASLLLKSKIYVNYVQPIKKMILRRDP